MTRALVTQMLEALELHADQYPHMQKGYTVDAIKAAREYLATEPSGEREKLIADLGRIAVEGMADYANTGYPNSNAIRRAADMLEADAQEMGKYRDHAKTVGDSRFEGWYAELNQSGKGNKQIAREAYEAGLNETNSQQAERVSMTELGADSNDA